MDAELGRRQPEDQPAAARIHARDFQHVLQERAVGVRILAEDHRMRAADHDPSPLSKPGGGEQQAADDLARLAAAEAERFGHFRAEQRIAHRDEDDPQGRLGDRPVLMAGAQMIDQLVDRLQYRIQRVAIAGEDHPGGERAGALLAERVEDAVDDLDRVGLVGAGALHRLLDAGADAIADQLGQRRLQARGRAEMVEQIGVGLADLWRRPPSASPPAAPARSARRARPRAPARLSSGVRRSRIDIYVSNAIPWSWTEIHDGARDDTPGPDDHAARPALRPRHAPGPLVDGRRSGRHRFLQRAVGDLPQGRGLLRRERAHVPRGRRPSSPPRSRRSSPRR